LLLALLLRAKKKEIQNRLPRVYPRVTEDGAVFAANISAVASDLTVQQAVAVSITGWALFIQSNNGNWRKRKRKKIGRFGELRGEK
jgi:hypothetical protein